MNLVARGTAGLVLAIGACHASPRTSVRAGGVEVRLVTGDDPGGLIGRVRAAVRGDWQLRSHDLRMTVAGVTPRASTERPGTVLEALNLGVAGVTPLRTAEPWLRVDGRDVAFADVAMEAVTLGDLPALRFTARVAQPDATLEVTREYTLEPGRDAMHVRTQVRNVGAQRVDRVTVGARLGWGGATPFAPGVGSPEQDAVGEAPWVGLATGGLAVGWATPDPGRALTFRFTADHHETARVGSETEVSSRPLTLMPGGVETDHATLFMLRGDLAGLSRAVAQSRSEPVFDATLRVLGRDRAEARVMVTDAEGRPAMLATPDDDGRAPVSLPEGRYVGWVSAPGHAVGDPVSFTVARGATGVVPVDLVLPPGSHIRVEAHDGDTDRDLPVRVTVRGVEGTVDPMLGPYHMGSGAGVVVVAASGRVEFPVAPGRYHVVVSHGPEWTLAERDVTVTETLRGDVTARLTHAVAMRGWVACDLHVHANPSFDSRVSIEDRVASLVAEGVGFATPTEHNVVGDYSAGVAVLPENVTEPLAWVPAVEVTTDRNAQPWGHFNIYPYRPDPQVPGGAAPAYLNVSPRSIFRAARANNPEAIIQVNHPRMQPNIGYFNVTGLDVRAHRAVSPEYDSSYDAIEVFNGFYVGAIGEVERVMRDWMSLLEAGGRYVATGSSDSHSIAYQWAGYPRTYAYLGGEETHATGAAVDTAAVLRAVREGRSFITSGPMLFATVGDAAPGDTVTLAGPRAETVRVRVRVQAAPWIAVHDAVVYRNGTPAQTIAVRPSTEPDRLDTEVPVQVARGDFVVVVAHGPRGNLERVLPGSQGTPWAMTNPIWFR